MREWEGFAHPGTDLALMLSLVVPNPYLQLAQNNFLQ